MRKKKGEKRYTPFSFPPTFQPHPRNNLLRKQTPYASQYHLIKLLYFSSSLKLHILKQNPLKDEKIKNILTPMLFSPNFFFKA
jgi:hypothetical protein